MGILSIITKSIDGIFVSRTTKGFEFAVIEANQQAAETTSRSNVAYKRVGVWNSGICFTGRPVSPTRDFSRNRFHWPRYSGDLLLTYSSVESFERSVLSISFYDISD